MDFLHLFFYIRQFLQQSRVYHYAARWALSDSKYCCSLIQSCGVLKGEYGSTGHRPQLWNIEASTIDTGIISLAGSILISPVMVTISAQKIAYQPSNGGNSPDSLSGGIIGFISLRVYASTSLALQAVVTQLGTSAQ